MLGAGVVGEAIQDDRLGGSKGRVGDDLELEVRKIYTRNPKAKKWFKHRPELFTSQANEVIDDPSSGNRHRGAGISGARRARDFP